MVIGRIGLRIRNSNFSGTRDELPQRSLISPFRGLPRGAPGSGLLDFWAEETFVFPPPVNEAGPAASFDSGIYFSSFAVFDVNLDVWVVMDFYLFQNILPVVIAVAVVAISWYLWRRKSKGFYVNSEQEELRSGDERAQNVSDKVKKEIDFLISI